MERSVHESPVTNHTGHLLSIEVEIADGFGRRRILGLLHRLFKFFRQDCLPCSILGTTNPQTCLRADGFCSARIFCGVGKVHVRALL